ncbi:transporter substrate-binding domain-containing protein [Marinomonas sp.]|uniref:transporter substrate-binding domain-containing protein n=1 Tax=Marinomonas sp. TaxID=1904862 RepID=UPI003BABE029
MTKSLKLIATLLALSVYQGAHAASNAITIATEGAYAPWNFTTSEDQLDGLEVDLAKVLCKKMAMDCTIVAQDWSGLIPALNAGKFDVIMASMFITDKRLEVMNFSQPYAIDPSSFAVEKDSELGKLISSEKISLNNPEKAKAAIEKLRPLLKGKIVGVQTATTLYEFLKTYFGDDIEIRTYKTTEQQDLDLAAGRVDAIYGQRTALAATLKNDGFQDFVIAGPGFYEGLFGRGVGAGVRKGDDELREKLNKAIQSAIADGTIKQLSEKWVGVDVTPGN